MRIYDSEEIGPWAASHGIDMNARRCDATTEGTATVYAVPRDAGRKTALARWIAGLYSGETVLLWIQLTGISASAENEFLFQMLRRAAEEERCVHDAPFQVFEPGDLQMFEAFLAVCLYFTWEFVVVNDGGGLMLEFDHHAELRVGGSRSDPVTAAHEAFRAFGLEEK